MTDDRTFEEFTEGQTRQSRGRTISEADVINFAGVTGDFHPLHVDTEFAEASSFGDRIAHGLLVLSIAASLAMEYNENAFFYGFESVRFVNPTFLDDTIRVETEIIDTAERDDNWGQVTTEATVRNQNDETVLVYELIELVERDST